MSNKIALLTGITGQDGSYLTELLLDKVMKSMALLGDLPVLILSGLTIYIKMNPF